MYGVNELEFPIGQLLYDGTDLEPEDRETILDHCKRIRRTIRQKRLAVQQSKSLNMRTKSLPRPVVEFVSQVLGLRNVDPSLWEVDDEFTQALGDRLAERLAEEELGQYQVSVYTDPDLGRVLEVSHKSLSDVHQKSLQIVRGQLEAQAKVLGAVARAVKALDRLVPDTGHDDGHAHDGESCHCGGACNRCKRDDLQEQAFRTSALMWQLDKTRMKAGEMKAHCKSLGAEHEAAALGEFEANCEAQWQAGAEYGDHLRQMCKALCSLNPTAPECQPGGICHAC